jgi:uncharacterized protein
MSLESRLMTDLKEAMKAKDQAAMRSIRAAKAAIILIKTDGSGTEIDESGEIKLIQKLVKQRQDSLDIFEKQNREDLAVIEREEIAVLQKYLPQQLSEEELTPIIQSLIEKTGASGMKDMGKIMGMASSQLSGQADGKAISAIVKKLLS